MYAVFNDILSIIKHKLLNDMAYLQRILNGIEYINGIKDSNDVQGIYNGEVMNSQENKIYFRNYSTFPLQLFLDGVSISNTSKQTC